MYYGDTSLLVSETRSSLVILFYPSFSDDAIEKLFE